MPPIVIAGGIAAAGALGGAALSSRASGKATEAELEASREAEQFAREQGAREEEAYKARWDAWQAGRNQLLERYGIDIAPPEGPGFTGGAPGDGPQSREDAIRAAMAESGRGGIFRLGARTRAAAEWDGIHGAPGGGAPGGTPGGAVPRPGAGPAQGGPLQGATLGDLMMRRPGARGEWHDWRRMGLRT